MRTRRRGNTSRPPLARDCVLIDSGVRSVKLIPSNPMNSPLSDSSPRRLIKDLIAISALLCALALPAIAQDLRSMLPAFGNDGADFTVKAKDGHATHGWLPKDWVDNSEWAAVNATYTKLTDFPDKSSGAVRIKVEKVDDGQLQLTTYAGNQKYQKGTHFLVSGWVRSPVQTTVKVGIRQISDPYEMYYEKDLNTSATWQPFEFDFTPTTDLQAFVMFIVRDAGTVDLAGMTVVVKQ